MDSTFDGIILGTGHNALVLQAYLGRLGLQTVAVDRALVAGGGLQTVEDPRSPGFRHNTHAFFLRAISAMPWFRDLDLARHGVRFIEPELNVALLARDGRSLCWWTDIEQTLESFRSISKADADELERWYTEFVPIVQRILFAEVQSPPLPPERRLELLSRSPLGRRFLEVSALSPLEFVERHFRNDLVRAGLLFFNGLREVDLREAGFGFTIPALLANPHKAQLCIGGSASLARGLVSEVVEHGGKLLLGTPIRRILIEQGKAVGIETTAGDRIRARHFVASGLNPVQTFVDLLDEADVPRDLADKARGFRFNLLAPLFALNLSLREPPRYSTKGFGSEIDRAFMVILGLERFEQFHDIVSCHEHGAIPETVMWGACPTLFDPSQAPAGGHTAFMWEKLPYALGGNPRNWDDAKSRHGEQMLQLWSAFASNLSGDAVIDRFTRSPLDVERSLPNMRLGDLLVGAFSGGQVGYHRPFPGAGNYRTPISGLYLCGGSTHPGGNVTGLCGYNAARVLAADLGLEPWWTPPDVEAAWSALPT